MSGQTKRYDLRPRENQKHVFPSIGNRARSQSESRPRRRNVRSQSVQQKRTETSDDIIDTVVPHMPRGRRSHSQSKAGQRGAIPISENIPSRRNVRSQSTHQPRTATLDDVIVTVGSTLPRGRRSQSQSKAKQRGALPNSSNTNAVSALAHTNSVLIDEYVNTKKELDRMRINCENMSKQDEASQKLVVELTNDGIQKDQEICRLRKKVRILAKRLGKCFIKTHYP